MKKSFILQFAICNLHWPIIALILVTTPSFADDGFAVQGMIEVTVDGKKFEGGPLAWDEQEVHLLGRDGSLFSFKPDEAVNFRKTSDQFRSYSVSELRAALLREMGNGYEVSGTSHYLILHPAGQRDVWAERFEELYRSFTRYFSVRGFQLSQPPFPLVGMVCKNRADFDRYSASQGGAIGGGILGYYSRESNRILVYDLGKEASRDFDNASVIIHEATHQTAFNTGIHCRYADPPCWAVEGLAMNFESRGVYDSGHYGNASDRVNRGRLDEFRRGVAKKHNPELLQALVATDDLVRSSSIGYPEAWAFTFFLIETEPRKFAQYLRKTTEREPFTKYDSKDRLADFTAIFGKDWKMLESHFLRFMADVK
jgi:hypothetical protein